jgi:hypothetical protein
MNVGDAWLCENSEIEISDRRFVSTSSMKKQNAGQPHQSSVRPTDTFATLIRRPAFASLPRIRPLCVSWSNLNSCMRFWSGLLRPSAALFQ